MRRSGRGGIPFYWAVVCSFVFLAILLPRFCGEGQTYDWATDVCRDTTCLDVYEEQACIDADGCDGGGCVYRAQGSAQYSK